MLSVIFLPSVIRNSDLHKERKSTEEEEVKVKREKQKKSFEEYKEVFCGLQKTH